MNLPHVNLNLIGQILNGITKFVVGCHNTWASTKYHFGIPSLPNFIELPDGNLIPRFSLGLTIKSLIFPRARLQYWIRDEHVTVDVVHFNHNPKKEFIEFKLAKDNKTRIRVSQPGGVPHVLTELHYWDAPQDEIVLQVFQPR